MRPVTARRAVRGLAAVLGAAALVVSAAACGAGGASGGKSATRIVIGTTADVVNYNPLVGNSRTDSWVTNLMYPKLMSMDMEGKRVPHLATSWEYAEGGTKARVKIRDDMKWTDGKPVSADDVVFTIDAVAKEKIGVVAGLISSYGSAKALSPTEVEFTLTKPDGTFLDNVGFWMAVVPAHVFGKAPSVAKFANDSDWVSAGPYKLTKVERGQRYVLDRVTPYPLAPDNTPNLEQVVFRVFGDVNTEVLALRNGEIDLVANALPPTLAKSVQNDNKLKTVEIPSLGWAHMQYNVQRAPLDKLEVRQALAAAVDYEAIRKSALQGAAVSSDSSVLTPTLKQWHDPSAQEYRHDVAKAKELLAKAGHADGLTLSMIYDQADPNIAKWAQLVRDGAKEAGIEIKLEGLERNTYVAKGSNRDFDIYAGSWAIMDNPPANLGLAFKCGGFINYANVCDPELDKLISQAQEQTDPQAAKDPIQRAARIISEQVYDNVLYVEKFTFAHGAKWTGFEQRPSELLSIVNPESLAKAKAN
ncbi:ABC transporter substrate-binding protein [Saccharothrix obliqua]|uniref:ABC transporter substrate-binding protein n=1 Tax=Saccharothrix obliqua TaxID=2861747 RepID=UPI001C5E7862|nr:ABC transporter substrate-binding protein [Saccharothrix obliqua]MBW4722481.1 ABC transporter substrate-binding protein [Saccharothrix obliqua]